MSSALAELQLRLLRANAVVVAVLLVAGIAAVVTHDGDAAPGAGPAPAASVDGVADPGDGDPGAPGPTAAGAPTTAPGGPADDGAGGAPPITRGDGTRGDGDPAELGPAAVPAPGTYDYDVQVTGEDGETRAEREVREVVRRSGDRTSGSVQLTVRVGEQSQIAVIDWSPDGARIRSTRVSSPLGTSDECRWEPRLLELDRLEDGADWTVDTSCTTTIEGVPSTFEVRGRTRVVGRDVTAGVATWRLQRDRTTTITADVGGGFEQVAREVGELWFDPARGIVVRSETTITLSGAQSGSSERVAVLVA